MSKKEVALQEKALQGAAPAEVQEMAATETEAAKEQKTESEEPEQETEREPLHLIVLAHPGTEDLVKQIWEKFYDLPFKIIPFQKTDTLVSLLESVMAMEDVDRYFAVIPANLVPCAPVRWSELQVPRADDLGHEKIVFWGRVPVRFDKEVLVDFLPYYGTNSDEEFVKFYVTERARPELVSHLYGNFYTKVLRANPCESVVIEGLMRRRFIYANAAGWDAIRDLLIQALL
ncbi:MAG: hypothetical protein IJV37_05540 [Bacteroidales bacterium]|nr:hypothetical protein [Bacteroidales bacterium]